MNIILSGFHGSGKTTSGYCLAKMARLPFYDVDHLLLENYSLAEVKDIPSLYRKLGEQAFRHLEVQKVKSLFTMPSGIVALGGGTLVSKEAQKLVQTLGKVVYLYVPYNELENRLKSRIEKRGVPGFLDAKDPYGSFKAHFEIRHEIYSTFATTTVNTDSLSTQEIAYVVWNAITRSEKKLG